MDFCYRVLWFGFDKPVRADCGPLHCHLQRHEVCCTRHQRQGSYISRYNVRIVWIDLAIAHGNRATTVELWQKERMFENPETHKFHRLNAWFGITLFLVITVYSYIFYKSRTLPAVNLNGTRSNLKKTWTSLLIIATFLVCFAMDVILFLLDGVVTAKDGIIMARRVTRVLHAINFICDPVIYAIRLPNVRKGYRKLWSTLSDRRHSLINHSTIESNIDN